MNFTYNSNYFRKVFSRFFTVHNIILIATLLLFLPKSMFVLRQEVGLDPSWVLSINMAFEKKLIFGKDYIFTFGPLGFFYTRFPIYVSKVAFFSFDFFLIATYIFIANYILKILTSKWQYFFFIISVILISTLQDEVFILYLYFLFFIFYTFHHKTLIALSVATGISILVFYIKLNLGLIIVVLLFASYIFLAIVKKNLALPLLLLSVIHVILLYTTSVLLNVDLHDYVISSFYIINAYNDAMYSVDFPQHISVLLIICALSVLLLYAAIPLFSLRAFIKAQVVFFYIVIALSLYLVFKQGFLRMSNGHVIVFFTSVLPLIGLFYLFVQDEKINTISGRAIALMTLPVLIAFCFIEELSNPFAFPYQDILGLKNYSEAKNFESNANLRKLPKRFLDKIGNRSVDVMPWGIDYIYYNNLTYNPRPVIQSYASYHQYLGNKNGEKYVSKSAPDFILYHIGSVDNRHPFWDDAQANLALLQKYTIVDSLFPNFEEQAIFKDSLLLFEKSPEKLEMHKTTVKELILKEGSSLKIPPSDKIQYVKVYHEYNLWGSLQRLLFQPPVVNASLTYSDGSVVKVRSVVPILKAGVLLNKRVLTNLESLTFFKTFGKENMQATQLSFIRSRWRFKKDIKVIIEEIDFKQ